MTRLKIYKQFLLLIIGTLLSIHCFSQDDNGNYTPPINPGLIPSPPPTSEVFYRGSVEGGGGLVIPVSNKALRNGFSGEYYVHFSFNYIFAQHIYGGLEFENTELIAPSSIVGYRTQLFTYNAGVKVGYYTYMQHDFLFCYSVSAGPSLIAYTYPVIPAPKQAVIFYNPEFTCSIPCK